MELPNAIFAKIVAWALCPKRGRFAPPYSMFDTFNEDDKSDQETCLHTCHCWCSSFFAIVIAQRVVELCETRVFKRCVTTVLYQAVVVRHSPSIKALTAVSYSQRKQKKQPLPEGLICFHLS